MPRSLDPTAGNVKQLGPKPVPRRRAPPRPMSKPTTDNIGQARVPSSVNDSYHNNDNLMQFSPGSPHNAGETEVTTICRF